MTGLPGAGKTQLAATLTSCGLTRLCPDEVMYQRHGRRGVDFPRGEYLLRERAVLDELAAELRKLLMSGRSAVLDHGLWSRLERDRWRTLVTEVGAAPVLVYLPVPHEVRWARVRQRNAVPGSAPSLFTEDDLRRYAARLEPPGADEPHIVYTGDPQAVLFAVSAPGCEA